MRSDAAVEAGGGDRGKPTNRLDTPPAHAAGQWPFTLLQDETMPPC